MSTEGMPHIEDVAPRMNKKGRHSNIAPCDHQTPAGDAAADLSDRVVKDSKAGYHPNTGCEQV
jgi:hypothetical protein